MSTVYYRNTYISTNAKHIHESGFTLVELMVVVAIIAILASIGLPKMTAFIRTAETSEAVEQCGRVVKAIGGYQDSHPRLTAAAIVAKINEKKTLSLTAAVATTLTSLIPQLTLAEDAQFTYEIAAAIGTWEGANNTLAICVKAWKGEETDQFVLYSSRAADTAEWEGNVYRAIYIDPTATAVAGGCCAADGTVIAACNGGS